ncbi:protoporphyrinogen oxidase HemJ [Zavarzinia compransoris]|uniref:Protoporphyrinogen IX oxidase n=1 Tax=Zavarzinia compransoris TaxID=1264899 RepID=A0A317E131_9PROT|nr:protoporphyrinogen oxidase HemJ [Zavarzinia compransoris]PWR20659.1 protoporphyrinogen oxidase HemJ [Zavarzinia compransoris]TDP44520.1 putative membrane protein [Zavarzinia compransoris]
MDFLVQHYDTLKVLHIIAFTTWMAGMFYLPRLFVYHADKPVGSDASETFKVMERRLLKAIINPSMVVTWIMGLSLMVATNALQAGGWFHAKLTLVLLMSAVHGVLVGQVRRFGRDERPHSARYYRILNEVPTVLFLAIVPLVVLKPF